MEVKKMRITAKNSILGDLKLNLKYKSIIIKY